jgi:hypothetical protein
MGGTCKIHAEMRNTNKSLTGNTQGKTSFVRTTNRWKNNIKIKPTQILCKCINYFEMVQNGDK